MCNFFTTVEIYFANLSIVNFTFMVKFDFNIANLILSCQIFSSCFFHYSWYTIVPYAVYFNSVNFTTTVNISTAYFIIVNFFDIIFYLYSHDCLLNLLLSTL